MHNGIIENHDELRADACRQRLRVRIADRHRSHRAPGPPLLHAAATCSRRCSSAVARAARRLRDRRDRRASRTAWSARAQGCPLLVGMGEGENFLASDAMALADVTAASSTSKRRRRRAHAATACAIVRRAAARRSSATCTCRDVSPARVELGPYRHYMQKEIFEQPRAIADTLEAVIDTTASRRSCSATAPTTCCATSTRVLILACGTSYYAGLVAQVLARSRSPASRARSRSRANTATATACRTRSTLVVTISQSGETADTLAALKHAQVARHDAHADDLQRARRARWCAQMRAALTHARRRRDRRRLDQGVHHAARRAVPADADARASCAAACDAEQEAALPEGAAPPAGACSACWRSSRRSSPGRSEFARKRARAVPRPRPALPDRARRRAQAQGDLATSTPRPIRPAS